LETQAHLIVDVARLARDGDKLKGEIDPAVLGFGPDNETQPDGGLGYDLSVRLVGEELLVRGTVRQRVSCLCSRCGCTFLLEVLEPEFLVCEQINASTDFLDLTEALREAIILALPGYPVCKETCKGLCMRCGKNLNAGDCSCWEPGSGDPWAALNGLDASAETVTEGSGAQKRV